MLGENLISIRGLSVLLMILIHVFEFGFYTRFQYSPDTGQKKSIRTRTCTIHRLCVYSYILCMRYVSVTNAKTDGYISIINESTVYFCTRVNLSVLNIVIMVSDRV